MPSDASFPEETAEGLSASIWTPKDVLVPRLVGRQADPELREVLSHLDDSSDDTVGCDED